MMVTIADEVERLHREVAELIAKAARRDRPLTPGQDSEIMAL
jgi:hypothetical protein